MRIVCPPWAMPTRAYPAPPMWKVGTATMLIECSSRPNIGLATLVNSDMAELTSIAPFGSPVVPEVYSCMATSSGSPEWPGSMGSTSATHAA